MPNPIDLNIPYGQVRISYLQIKLDNPIEMLLNKHFPTMTKVLIIHVHNEGIMTIKDFLCVPYEDIEDYFPDPCTILIQHKIRIILTYL